MILHAVDWLFARTFRSVWFGILVLILLAGYIAVGSAFEHVREFFEMDELAFFRAWPLTTLMVLLIVTLGTVTIERIPFTPPRYGVWAVHIGIVTLVIGGFYHYTNKLEGTTVIELGQTQTHYFDRWERALYVRANDRLTQVTLPALPRFHAYDARQGDRYLDRAGLRDLAPVDAWTRGKPQTIGDLLGAPDLKLSIIGYWPYANIRQRLKEGADGAVGFELSLKDETQRQVEDRVLIGSSEIYKQAALGPLAFAHRLATDQASVDAAVAAGSKIHALTVRAPGFAEQTIHVGVGQQVPLGESGYIVQVDSFDPAWRTIDQQIVPLLSLSIKTPTQIFRRQLIPDRKPTDWKLGVAGKGPMGERQTQPLDDQLITTYRFDDALELLPREGALYRYIFYTTPGSTETTVLGVGLNERTTVQKLSGDEGKLRVLLNPRDDAHAMQDAISADHDHHAQIGDMQVRRREKAMGVEPSIEEVPLALRDKDEGRSGIKQVVLVRATLKEWQKDIFVPFNDTLRTMRGGLLEVPGATMPAQIQLGNTLRPLPAEIRLDKFEAEAYAGLAASANVAMRDFRSQITITERGTRKETKGVVFLNSPVLYQNGNWIFFQSGWDPQRQSYTVLGIGNRPGTLVMLIGCILIVVGIFYAFYIKPIIIKAMKESALKKVKIIAPPPLPEQKELEAVAS